MMGYIKAAAVGLLAGIVLGVIPTIIGYIPVLNMINFCTCLLTPGLIAAAGYVSAMMFPIKKDDFVNLALSNALMGFVAVFVSTLVGTIVGVIAGAMGGGDLMSAIVAALIGNIIAFVGGLITYLIFGLIGGIVYMFTGAKK